MRRQKISRVRYKVANWPDYDRALQQRGSVTAWVMPGQHIRMIGDKGRMGWQKPVGYGRRSHAETAIFCFKAIIGSSLRARTLPAQKTEAKAACSVLNRMPRLGLPKSQRMT